MRPLQVAGAIVVAGTTGAVAQTSLAVPTIATDLEIPGVYYASSNYPTFLAKSYSAPVFGVIGNGDEPWLGPGISADLASQVFTSSHYGGLVLSSTITAPTQPDPNGGVSFYYSASVSSDVTGVLSYDFEVNGPTPTVPVVISAKGILAGSEITSNSYQNEELSFQVDGVVNDSVQAQYGTVDSAGVNNTLIQGHASISGGLTTGYMGNITENDTYLLTTGEIYIVTMQGSISNNVYTQSSGDGVNALFVPGGSVFNSVEMDPGFSIAPGTPNAALYTFSFSPGVTDVPEPSTWAMMLLGFAGLGYAGYRRARARRAMPI